MAPERIRLVPLEVGDAEEMVEVLSGADLYTFTGGAPPTLAELRERYARQVVGRSPDGREEWHNWIIRTVADDEAVGYVQATIADAGRRADVTDANRRAEVADAGLRAEVADAGRRAEIAWVVSSRRQGRGYASEAARALVAWLDGHGVATIEAHIHPRHVASAAVARKAGLLPTERFDDGERLWRRSRDTP
jgi:RimJ/RimL family protein N-acetyltransferase